MTTQAHPASGTYTTIPTVTASAEPTPDREPVETGTGATRVMSLAGDCWIEPPAGIDSTDPDRPLLACLTGDGRTLYPVLQFDADDQPRPELAPALRPLLAAGVSGWMIAGWLLAPRGDLSGQSPDAVLRDPSGEHEAVYRLARAAVLAPSP